MYKNIWLTQVVRGISSLSLTKYGNVKCVLVKDQTHYDVLHINLSWENNWLQVIESLTHQVNMSFESKNSGIMTTLFHVWRCIGTLRRVPQSQRRGIHYDENHPLASLILVFNELIIILFSFYEMSIKIIVRGIKLVSARGRTHNSAAVER